MRGNVPSPSTQRNGKNARRAVHRCPATTRVRDRELLLDGLECLELRVEAALAARGEVLVHGALFGDLVECAHGYLEGNFRCSNIMALDSLHEFANGSLHL